MDSMSYSIVFIYKGTFKEFTRNVCYEKPMLDVKTVF